MKSVFKKRIISLIIISVVLVGGLFAKTSIALNAGSISSVFFYDQNGVLVNNITSPYISITDTLVVKTSTSKAVFTYKYGNIVLDKESILVIKEKNSNFTFYLVDGTAEISSKSSSFGAVSIITPVTSYTLNGVADINVISTDKKEGFDLYFGTTTVFNSITGKTYNVHENSKMNLNTPVLVSLNDLDKKESRETFINTTFPYGIKAITKSDDTVDQYVLNILSTGNGQGNINLLNFATFKGILNEADKKNEKYLLIDAGNTLAGSVYVNQDKGETATKVLDAVGYDVLVPGSYDFAYGYEQLQELDKNSNVTFVSTNALTDDGYNILTPYQLYAYNDLRIAIVGLSNPSALTELDNLEFNSQLIIDNAQDAIDMAKQYVDLVILVTNYSDEYINSRVIARNLKGIDLIIDGSRSIAGTYKENDTYIISTGVGYNKIIDTQVSVYKDNIISINPVIIHSSNVTTDNKNLLASSLGINDYTNDQGVIDLLSEVTIKDGYSPYLISPNKASIKNTTEANTPNVPKFTKFIIRKAIVSDDSDESSNNIAEIDAMKVEAPKFVANTVKQTSVTENKDTTLATSSSKSFGVKTTLEGTATAKNFDFSDYELPLQASLIPYFTSKNFTLALYFDASIIDALDTNGRDIDYSITPVPTTGLKDIFQYSINFIDELSFSLNNESINFDLSKGTFDSPIKSPLVYRKLGSNDLTLTSNIEIGSLNSEAFLTDPTLEDYYSGTDKEQAGIVETLSLMDSNLKLQVAGLAVGQNGTINTYPVISSTYTFLNKSNYSLSWNLNGATLVKYLPNLEYDTIQDNYLVGSSLILEVGDRTIEAGANYIVTDDTTIFNTNLLHKEFYKTDLFNDLDTNSIVPFISLDCVKESITTHLSYSLPLDISDMEFENDIADFSFDYTSDKFTAGMFYIQGDLYSDIKNFSTVKDFLFSSKVEYGLNATWNINNMLSSSMTAGVTTTTVDPLYLNLSFTLDLDKDI
jgi:hypothetical protein